jgi:quercetin dioxygenase-like cupin family protein
MLTTKVKTKGQRVKILYEVPVAGHLTELNGKYKFRVSEVVYDPGGYAGPHHHVGPGVRMVQSGAVTIHEGGKDHVHRQGEFYFEAGNVTHTAANHGHNVTRYISFEILPVHYKGRSTVPPP